MLRRAILQHWPWYRGRWRLASFLYTGSPGGRSALPDEWVLARIPPAAILECRHGLRIRVEPDPMYVGPFLFGDYEPGSTSVFLRTVQPGMVVFDVGANFGWYSALLGRHARVVAFEPVPPILARLRDTLSINGVDVDVRPYGLGAVDGQFTVHTFAHLPHGHASAFDLGREDAQPWTCQVRRLDDVIAEVGKPDFIKVDVEGSEPDVLEGGRELLSSRDAPILAFEVNVECLAARGMTPADLLAMVRRFGYGVQRILPNGELSNVMADGNADYLARKP